jgi:hypothetical protein
MDILTQRQTFRMLEISLDGTRISEHTRVFGCGQLGQVKGEPYIYIVFRRLNMQVQEAVQDNNSSGQGRGAGVAIYSVILQALRRDL